MPPKKSKNALPDRGVVVVKPGTPVMYIGLVGSKFSCPSCSRRIRKGIVYRAANGEFCSRQCIPAGS